MSSAIADKISGTADTAIGNVKQGIGKLVGSEKLQAEGLAQEAKGEALKATGATKQAVNDGADKVADTINKAI